MTPHLMDATLSPNLDETSIKGESVGGGVADSHPSNISYVYKVEGGWHQHFKLLPHTYGYVWLI